MRPNCPGIAALALGASLALGPGPAGAGEAASAPREDFPEFLARSLGLGPPAPLAPEGQRFHLAVLPFVLANPLMGAGGGVAALGGFRLGGPETSFSRFELSAFASTRSQVGLVLRTGIRLPADGWMLVGDWGFGRFPNPAYGLGGHTTGADRTLVERRQLQLHETVYRRLVLRLFAGLGYDLDLFSGLTDQRSAAGAPTRLQDYPYGTAGRSVSSGLSLHLLWDGRDSPVAPTAGSYLLARWRFEPDVLGTPDGDWTSVYLDGRSYLRVPGRRDVVGLWAFAWTSHGHTPYLLLPSVGVDPEHRSGRGVVEGRFTAKDLLYAELEYRVHLWEFLGAVAAVNVTAPSERGTGRPGPRFQTLHPALAAGLRLLLDRASGSNLVLDGAWAPREGFAFYVNANETF